MSYYRVVGREAKCTQRKTIVSQITLFLVFISFSLGTQAENQLQNSGRFDEQSVQYLIAKEAIEDGRIPVLLAIAIAKVASDFSPHTRDINGAIGLMQVQPALISSELGVSEEMLWDPKINIRVALFYLSRLHYRYEGEWTLVLSHYFGGPLNNRRGRAVPHDYTRNNVEQVIAWWDRYSRDALLSQWSSPRFKVTTVDRFRDDGLNYSAVGGSNYSCDRPCVPVTGAGSAWYPTSVLRANRFNGGSRWVPVTGSRFR